MEADCSFAGASAGRAEMEADCPFVVERHHLAPIWASGGSTWMRTMLATNAELTSQRPTLKEVTPEVGLSTRLAKRGTA